MAPQERSIPLILATLACFLIMHSIEGALPSLMMSEIAKGTENTCIVALLSTNSNAKVLQILEEIREQLKVEAVQETITTPEIPGRSDAEVPLKARQNSQFSSVLHVRTPAVKLGIIEEEFKWSETKRVEFKNKSSQRRLETYNFVLFPPTKKDRSCLLSPPKFFPKGVAYFGANSKETIIEFINAHCNTYLGINGGLSVEGLNRMNILENVYRLNSTRSTMAEILFVNNGTCANNQTCKDIHAIGIEKENDPVADSKTKSGTSQENAENCGQNQESIACNSKSEKPTQQQTKSDPQLFTQEINNIAECDRITNPTKENFFKNYLQRSRPVVISDGAAHWPAITKWTMDYFKKAYGDKQVHIKLAPNGIFEGVEPASLWEENEKFVIPEAVRDNLRFPDLVVVRPATQDVRFSEFLEMIENSSKQEGNENRPNPNPRVSAYLEYSSIPTYFPHLEEDIVEPPFIRNVLDRLHLNIWISDGNTLGKLHFDPFDNFLCQLKGRKELILFEPHDNHQLYEVHIPEALLGFDPVSKRFRRKKLMDSTSMVMSPVDIRQPDFERFPEFAEARPLNCTIDEGDILFMPAFWWHEVQSYPNLIEGRNLAVNFWYEPFLKKEFPCPECKLDVNPYYRHLL